MSGTTETLNSLTSADAVPDDTLLALIRRWRDEPAGTSPACVVPVGPAAPHRLAKVVRQIVAGCFGNVYKGSSVETGVHSMAEQRQFFTGPTTPSTGPAAVLTSSPPTTARPGSAPNSRAPLSATSPTCTFASSATALEGHRGPIARCGKGLKDVRSIATALT